MVSAVIANNRRLALLYNAGSRQMKPWHQYVLLNAVFVIAIICSLFVVPGATPFRVWFAVSGFTLATLNFVLHRRLTQSGRKVVPTIAIFFGLALLFAEGGWQQLVVLVALAVTVLIGLILWIARKTVHET